MGFLGRLEKEFFSNVIERLRLKTFFYINIFADSTHFTIIAPETA